MTSSLLWYRGPAKRWVEALPIGNGRLGAMVFGGVDRERLQLNEDSLWTGGREDADNPAALTALSEIRRLLFAGRYAEAQRLTDQTQVRKASPRGDFGSYTTLGELYLSPLDDVVQVEPADYRRTLDLARGIASTQYRLGAALYEREYFASAPDQVLVLHLTSSARDLAFSLTLSRPLARTHALDDATLCLSGQLSERSPRDFAERPASSGMRYAAFLGVACEGGELRALGDELCVRGAAGALIVLSAATDYRSGDFAARAQKQLGAALRQGYAALRARHIADHEPRMRRVTLELPPSPRGALPTDERLLRSARGEPDPELDALYFQLGRYLLWSSSQPGSLAANLQGIWAEGLENPWNGDYHTNINLQMNYWLAEPGNLSECVQPLLELIERMREPGRRTARVHYGARGWVVHTVHNVWGFTAPGEAPSWGLFPMAAAWLCQHLWERYAFGQDLDSLRAAWPCLREATEFCLDWLVRDPGTGRLVSGPANSPENTFVTPDGDPCSISMGPSMDQQILWDHFTNVLDAADALGIADAFTRDVARAREQLALPQIGPDGRLLEWAQPFAELEPNHRHVSHLFGLHPGRQLTPRGSPEWCEAARRSLEARGDGGSGWSRAWKICFWARLGDGDRAWRLLRQLLTPVALEATEFTADGPGVYPNLLCAHPPFQIDGNLGAAAGIAEMLLQSHEGALLLLPALPSAWPSGRVNGLCGRGAFVVDLAWQEGRLTHARVHSLGNRRCTVRYAERGVTLQAVNGATYDLTRELCG